MIQAIDFDVIVGSIEIPNSPEGPFSVEPGYCFIEYLHGALATPNRRAISSRPRVC